ncbi:glycoside hydrolase family 16 protein [Piedraia hortae CBS 480.64]|uniref:Glycoside hydrolase family 16 protein n=1 Tax=Piedraia hortae CBS 480.64 TaxID=1314780 RepID=A0A6A7C5I4_9PEZI|nr:glycoside hydrolase family 16 protein [Piedraia hortae CBS 480.64]
MLLSLGLCGLVLGSQLASAAKLSPKDCPCGFRDPKTSQRFTDAIVVYFNESKSIDTDQWIAQDFKHRKEKGWNSIYRVGASPDNVKLTSNTFFSTENQVLELLTDPATQDHLVTGASLRSVRQDIQYGTFRAGLRPAGSASGGVSLAFQLRFNDSESLSTELMNMDSSDEARAAYLVNGEFPDPTRTTNFTTLEHAGVRIWDDFTHVRMDWNKTNVDFWVADNNTRSLTKKKRSLPRAGQPLFLHTFSTGDSTYMGGPPLRDNSRAYVLYVRAFFNSSTMSAADHHDYDKRCAGESQCTTEDPDLRGYSAFGVESERKWKDEGGPRGLRVLAGVVAAACSIFGIFALINTCFRRTPFHKMRPSYRRAKRAPPPSNEGTLDQRSSNGSTTKKGYFVSGTSSGYSTPGIQTPLPMYSGLHTPRSGAQTPVPPYASMVSLPRSSTPQNGPEERPLKSATITSYLQPGLPFREQGAPPTAEEMEGQVRVHPPETDVKGVTNPLHIETPPPPKKQIDYLAGLVAVACFAVSVHHFCQTFWPYISEDFGPIAHYPKAEKYLAKILGNVILTQLWIGPFFLTATRFLTTNYLKNGRLDDVAKKTLRRAPRLFVPILIIATAQYFLLSMNITSALQYLPSVSWSTWPYVVAPPNFGVYMDNLIELAYLMPNAVPAIVSHYCVGVLWTVPVQLQFTYQILLATVMIRDICTPYKRFGFYALAIILGWYARSWAACHWCGLLLSDLEATYKWRKALNQRPPMRYLIILGATVLALGACAIGASNRVWSFESHENAIHPNFFTGKPIGRIYPEYFEPTLAILIFSISLQVLVELSTWVQWFLSLRPILWMRPHVMTIYLLHGFVQWTWGAWVAVELHMAHVPYWANLIITFLTSYFWLFLLAYILTPLLEFPTQALMRNIDRWSKHEPVPKRRTTAPFGKAIVLNRNNNEEKIEA